MQTKVMLLAVAAVVALGLPLAAHADEAVSLTNQAIVELTDAPGLGARPTVDLTKRWGADLGQINKAVALLQDARSKASGANTKATRLLEEAIDYGQAKLHKEARVAAQGALAALCQGGGGDGCDKAPKFGAYVAP